MVPYFFFLFCSDVVQRNCGINDKILKSNWGYFISYIFFCQNSALFSSVARFISRFFSFFGKFDLFNEFYTEFVFSRLPKNKRHYNSGTEYSIQGRGKTKAKEKIFVDLIKWYWFFVLSSLGADSRVAIPNEVNAKSFFFLFALVRRIE